MAQQRPRRLMPCAVNITVEPATTAVLHHNRMQGIKSAKCGVLWWINDTGPIIRAAFVMVLVKTYIVDVQIVSAVIFINDRQSKRQRINSQLAHL